MTDHLDSNTILRLSVRTLLLSFFAVIGVTVSLCGTPSCGSKVICALIPMASGGTLFTQIVCAQVARHYRDGLGTQTSLST